jgi:NAD-dependent deacetylase
MNETIRKLEILMNEAKRICFFTGAGMSTESGIPDFRSSSGLWAKNQSFVDVVSRSYFEKHPIEFWQAFKEIFRVKLMQQYEPNQGHVFIAELEKKGKTVHIITQNIDGLHQRAGSTNVYEIHGTIRTATCHTCKKKYHLSYINAHDVPKCENCHTILKPDVVLFGDAIHYFEEALDAAYQSDLFLVLGSSLEVTPINQIPIIIATETNIPTVIINKDRTRFDHLFDVCIHAKIGEVLQQLHID